MPKAKPNILASKLLDRITRSRATQQQEVQVLEDNEGNTILPTSTMARIRGTPLSTIPIQSTQF